MIAIRRRGTWEMQIHNLYIFGVIRFCVILLWRDSLKYWFYLFIFLMTNTGLLSCSLFGKVRFQLCLVEISPPPDERQWHSRLIHWFAKRCVCVWKKSKSKTFLNVDGPTLLTRTQNVCCLFTSSAALRQYRPQIYWKIVFLLFWPSVFSRFVHFESKVDLRYGPHVGVDVRFYMDGAHQSFQSFIKICRWAMNEV